jgi:hypothetical protein
MKPFLSGRPKHDQPALARDAAHGSALPRLHEAHSAAATGAVPASGPSVECVKQGDKVVRLIITCACGERIEVDCLYPGGA